ncbi:MAG: phosphoribosyltransferase family protein [Sulfurimonas sp.]|nr:phosphoribosyltransferase family protein [Sulfurimonas sp.]
MKYYAYEEFKNDTNTLIKKVRDFHPEAILAIARGGLTLAHVMAEGLDIREVQSVRTELYDKTSKRDTITIFDSCVFENKFRILVVDDIADSGETLEAIMKHLVKKYPQIEFKSATLFYKTTSIYEPNFWVKEADDWIDFFWERDFKS